MIGKSIFLALAGLPLLVSASPGPVIVNYGFVEQIKCDLVTGSAVRLHGGQYVSAHHVTANTGCKVRGQPITVTSFDELLDFSTFTIERAPRRGAKVNCAGIMPGEWIFAVGYAGGLPVQRMVTIRHHGFQASNGMAILHGRDTIIPGMSGGIGMNQAGEVVAINNMYNPMLRLSLLRELKDTALCR